MSGFDIQAKVKAGLAKASNATGGSTFGTVQLIVRTGKASTPLDAGSVNRSYVPLKNAIFKSIKSFPATEQLVIDADIEMVSDGDVAITIGDQVTRAGDLYVVDDVITSNPAGVVLSYISLLRKI